MKNVTSLIVTPLDVSSNTNDISRVSVSTIILDYISSATCLEPRSTGGKIS